MVFAKQGHRHRNPPTLPPSGSHFAANPTYSRLSTGSQHLSSAHSSSSRIPYPLDSRLIFSHSPLAAEIQPRWASPQDGLQKWPHQRRGRAPGGRAMSLFLPCSLLHCYFSSQATTAWHWLMWQEPAPALLQPEFQQESVPVTNSLVAWKCTRALIVSFWQEIEGLFHLPQ